MWPSPAEIASTKGPLADDFAFLTRIYPTLHALITLLCGSAARRGHLKSRVAVEEAGRLSMNGGPDPGCSAWRSNTVMAEARSCGGRALLGGHQRDLVLDGAGTAAGKVGAHVL